MKKQTLLLAAVSILLLSSCEKEADAVSPDASAMARLTGESSDSSGTKPPCGPHMPGKPPKPEEVMAHLDLDKDNQISVAEAKGPLAKDFSKVDADQNGFITLEELKKCPPPKPPMGGNNQD